MFCVCIAAYLPRCLRVWVICSLLFAIDRNVYATTRTQQATFLCFANNTDNTLIHFTFRVLANTDSVIQIVAYDASSPALGVGKKTGCTSVQGNGTAVSPLELTVTVDTDDPASITALTSTCGVQEVSAGQVYKFRLRTIGDRDLDLGTDAYYDCQCDMSNLLSGWKTVGPTYVFGSRSVTLQELPVGADLRLVDRTTDLPVTVVELGAEVYLQVVYNPQTQKYNPFDSCGTSFWVVLDTPSPSNKQSYKVYVISATTLKAQVSFWNTTTTHVTAAITVDPLSSAEVAIPDHATGKGILITSSENIYVMAQSVGNGDTYMMTFYPRDTLGSAHDVVTSGSSNFVLVLGSEDQTTVNVASSVNSITVGTTIVPAGQTTNKIIQDYDVLSISSNDDLTGVTIISTKPISVFTGYDDGQSTLHMQQLVCSSKLGTRFILPRGTGGQTKCVASKTGTTTLKYHNGTTAVTKQIIQHGHDTISMNSVDFVELLASEAVSCLASFGGDALAVLPPVQQWGTSYVFHVAASDVALTSVYIAILNGSETGLRINQNSVTSSVTSVRHYSTDSTGSNLVAMTVRLTSSITSPVSVYHASQPFMALVVQDNGTDVVASTVPPGLHMSDIFLSGDPSCTKTSGFRGDLVDNDCDGSVDEDTDMDTDNSYPDSPAKLIDSIHPVRVRPFDCKAKPNDAWADGGISKVITQSSGCLPSGSDLSPFTPASTFNMTSDSMTYPAVYNTGYLTMPRFENQPDVYIRCKLEFCFRFDDTTCTTRICKARRKRVAENDPDTASVDLHVTVTDKQTVQTNQDDPRSAEEICMEDHGFIGVLGVLGSIVVIALIVTSCLYCRVRRTFVQEPYLSYR